MSEEVFGKLSELHGQVRARIEASPDWKVLQAVERAMGEVKSILPVAPVVAAVEAVAEAAAVEAPAAEPAPAEAAAEPAVAEAPAAEAPAVEAACEAAAEVEAASAAEATPVPAELQELAADVTSTVPDAAPASNGATTH